MLYRSAVIPWVQKKRNHVETPGKNRNCFYPRLGNDVPITLSPQRKPAELHRGNAPWFMRFPNEKSTG